MERKVYIDNQPLEEALKLYLDSAELRVEAELIDISDAFDRVTFEPVYAKRSSPIIMPQPWMGLQFDVRIPSEQRNEGQ